MEKVQFQLEATLPELKDLHEKGLFTKHEIDQITRRRTAFETSLIRQVTRKEDFFKYAEYEINLERLRKVRWKRLGYDKARQPPSASTFSIPRRVMYILKRATAKFPQDLAVWLAYVEYAGKEGMRKVVLQGLTSALQHHPLSSTLYLLLSYHHLHPTSPLPASPSSPLQLADATPLPKRKYDTPFSLDGTATARTTLLLGLRTLPQSQDLWREYIKLELGWVEALRRRWTVLGIQELAGTSGKAKGKEVELDPEGLVGGEGAFGPEGEDARRAILRGQLVEHAIRSALEAIPAAKGAEGMRFREELVSMLRVYPSPLRARALDVVFEELEKLGEGVGDATAKARARLMCITRKLYERECQPDRQEEGESRLVLEGVELVEKLGAIGKRIKKAAKEAGGTQWGEVAGDWLGGVMEQCGDNADLREYILSIITALTKPAYKPSSRLLLLHLDLLAASPGATVDTLLTTSRSHAAQHPSNPQLAQRRLDAEIQSPSIDASHLRKVFPAVLEQITTRDPALEDQDAIELCWFAWVGFEEGQHKSAGASMESCWRTIIRKSLQLCSADLHSRILARYFTSYIEVPGNKGKVLEKLATITATYRPSREFYSLAFGAVAERSPGDLARLYEVWRGACKTPAEKVEAGLRWAQWLGEHGKAGEAAKVVGTVRSDIRNDEVAAAELERGWKAWLDGQERESMEEDGQEDSSEDEDTSSDEEDEDDDESMSSDGGDAESDGDEDEDGKMEISV